MKIACTVAVLLSLSGCGAQYKSTNSAPVVFIGDSITQFWKDNLDFSSRNWIDKRISGQTATEIAVRFDADVIAVHPAAVHILAGTNDLIPVRHASDPRIPLAAMIKKAQAARIKVYIGTVPPWGDGSVAMQWDTDYSDHNHRIRALNAWIKAQSGVTVIDYYKLLTDSQNLYKPTDTDDGVHPSAKGFAVMTNAVCESLNCGLLSN